MNDSKIKEGEGQPINYLLGILIKQDLEAGTVTLTQELAATKLADAFLTEEEKVKAARGRWETLVLTDAKLVTIHYPITRINMHHK